MSQSLGVGEESVGNGVEGTTEERAGSSLVDIIVGGGVERVVVDVDGLGRTDGIDGRGGLDARQVTKS